MQLPYQLVEVLIVNLSSLVCKITAHCDNDIVGAVVLRLGLGEIQKRIDLIMMGMGYTNERHNRSSTNARVKHKKDHIWYQFLRAL